MQQNNHEKQQTVLPSFHSLLSTLGESSNESIHPSININTWARQPESVTSLNNQSLPQFQSLERALESNNPIHAITTTTCTTPSLGFTSLPSSTTQFDSQSPKSYLSASSFSPQSLYPLSNSTNSPSAFAQIPSSSSSPNMPLTSPTIHQNFIQSPSHSVPSSSSSIYFIPPSSPNKQQLLQRFPAPQDEQHAICMLEEESITNRRMPTKTSTETKLKPRKSIKFINNNNFKSSNYSVSAPPLQTTSSSAQKPNISVEDLEVTNVKFSMEKQTQPKRKRRSNPYNKSSPTVNQSESTNSDHSSTSSIPLPANPASSSTSPPPQQEVKSDPVLNSGLFMEFVGTTPKKRKQYRDIINYKDEFFTDSYSTTEKRLRESSTKYRSKQPLNPTNKKSEK